MKKVTILISILLLVSLPLYAQQSTGKVGIGLFGSAIRFVGSEKTPEYVFKDLPDYNLFVQKNADVISPWFGISPVFTLSDRIGLELSAAGGFTKLRAKGNSGLSKYFKVMDGYKYRTFLYPFTANLRLNLNPSCRFNPYLVGGFGALFWDVRDISDNNNDFFMGKRFGKIVSKWQWNLITNIGLGTELFLTEHFALDLSLRYQYLLDRDEAEDMTGYHDTYAGHLEGRGGIAFYWGGWKDTDGDLIEDKLDAAPKEPEDMDNFQDADGAPDLDNDLDGILDVNDKAPDLAEDKDGFEDMDGVPDPDNDKDGILDKNDKDPNKAEDVDGFEDQDGAPDPDNDKDGIPDDKDQCPLEPESMNGYMDDDGCPDKKPEVIFEKKAPIVLEGITFLTGSSTLSEEAKVVLGKVVRTLQDYKEMELEINGHTDNTGKRSTNLSLSQKRADAVKAFLVNQGIDASRLVTKGIGPDKPVESNDTKEGRAKNRRIEFIRSK